MSHRGKHSLTYSDKATNFTGGTRELSSNMSGIFFHPLHHIWVICGRQVSAL
ncbi:hypothetical protein PR048_024162 [Dryococelus australis]|uniref:Uncharacterized protein n=1 Tax=Dryococelus australis TaxID=614101 RepID=A0ABQ9GW41_9NEOP|nr:hypothetical protein PR048_024162 [Dryococelus australis]